MKRKRLFGLRFTVFILVLAVCATGFIWANDAEYFVNTTIFGNTRTTTDTDNVINFDGGMSIHFIDVGQGDAAVIQFANGQTMMIDAGDNRRTQPRINISNYLQTHIFPGNTPNIIDYFIATHSHADHIGAANYLFDNYYIGHIVRPLSFHPNEIAANIPETFGLTAPFVVHDTVTLRTFGERSRAHISHDGTPATVSVPYVGKIITIGDAVVEFFSPTTHRYTAAGINQLSTIFTVTFAGRTVMFTGDAYVENELRVLDTLPTNIDVLDVGHHGSTTSTSYQFLRRINPTYAIIQVGAGPSTGNTYGHPHNAVINRLNDLDINILMTSELGDILVQISLAGDLAVAGMVSTSDVFWVYYWMMAAVTAVIFFIILFTVDFLPSKNTNTRNNGRNNNRNNQRRR
ncbi:MAG: MBL fold metallo-hydrolase [Firmicutes bacterium]|nr:MBL fold metallo-hydrolase [Bacillota bacterium]